MGTWWSFTPRKQSAGQPLPYFMAQAVYLVGPGELRGENGRFLLQNRAGKVASVNPEGVEFIYCLGSITVTASALSLASRRKIDLAWLNSRGDTCFATICVSRSNRALLRQAQLRLFDQPRVRIELARECVVSKIRSMQGAARHYQRQGKRLPPHLLEEWDVLEQACSTVEHLDQLRGIEGRASAQWFAYFSGLMREPFVFTRRLRRPPPDPINSLLSLGYTLLLRRMTARLAAQGFETMFGFLHDYRPGRPSLACDLIEPLRIPCVDRWVLSLCNQRRLTLSDFVSQQSGAVHLLPTMLPKVLGWWEEYWHQEQYVALLGKQIHQLCQVVKESREQKDAILQQARQGGQAELEDDGAEDFTALDDEQAECELAS